MRLLLSSREWTARLSVLLLLAAGLIGPVLHPLVHGASGGETHSEVGNGHDDETPDEAPATDVGCALCVVSAAPPTAVSGTPIPAAPLVDDAAPDVCAPGGPDLVRALPPRAPPAA